MATFLLFHRGRNRILLNQHDGCNDFAFLGFLLLGSTGTLSIDSRHSEAVRRLWPWLCTYLHLWRKSRRTTAASHKRILSILSIHIHHAYPSHLNCFCCFKNSSIVSLPHCVQRRVTVPSVLCETSAKEHTATGLGNPNLAAIALILSCVVMTRSRPLARIR